MGCQHPINTIKFLKCEPWNFHDNIVDGRFKTGFSDLRNIVGNLIKGIPDGQLRGNLGYRESGGLGSQGGTPRYARIHFNNHQCPVVRIQRKLNVGSAGINTDFSDDADRRVSHMLIFFIRQGHGRGHRDTVSGMHTHWIEILDGADNDDIVFGVPHHF